MTDHNDSIAIILANRRYIYTLLQHVFGHEPSVELVEALAGRHTREAFELIGDEDEQLYEVYLNLFADLNRTMMADPSGTLEQLKNEYTYLMFGPGKLPAPPWESVYLSKERVVFQESTLKVRNAYREYHLLPQNYPHEADDHLAYELDFMRLLAESSLERFVMGDVEGVTKLLNDQKRFLEEHLLVWSGKFSEKIQRSKSHHLYPQMASLTDKFLTSDAAILPKYYHCFNELIPTYRSWWQFSSGRSIHRTRASVLTARWIGVRLPVTADALAIAQALAAAVRSLGSVDVVAIGDSAWEPVGSGHARRPVGLEGIYGCGLGWEQRGRPADDLPFRYGHPRGCRPWTGGPRSNCTA